MATSAPTDPLTRLLSRFGIRDLGHAAAAYLAAVLVLVTATPTPNIRAALLAGIPAAASVLFRQLFPHVTVNSREVNTAITLLESALTRAKLVDPVIANAAVAAQKTADILAAAAPANPATPVPGPVVKIVEVPPAAQPTA